MSEACDENGGPRELVGDVRAQLERELFNGHNNTSLPEIEVPPSAIYRTIPDKRVQIYLGRTTLYDTVAQLWTTVSAALPEDGLSEQFTMIMNDILQDSCVSYASARDTRTSLLASSKEYGIGLDKGDKGLAGKTSPDICIMGTGCNFVDANPDDGPSYLHCIAPVEVMSEASLNELGLRSVALQIAVYVRQCFNHQPNRRFACALVLTENSFRLMVFNRSGAVQTGTCNIHQEPQAFVRIILGISSIHDRDLSCFDDAIRWLPPTSRSTQSLRLTLTNFFEVAKEDLPVNNVDIFLHPKPFARRSICGRGTKCWTGVIVDNGARVHVVVKDSWQAKGRELECTLLKRVARLDGVVKLLYYSEITEQDRISHFRSVIFDCPPFLDSDRLFSRVVLEAYGPPIHHFSSALQLLQALRDAVAGHRHMWKAGILHRDISVHNILLGRKDATVGNRGILIDLDMAIEVRNYKKNAEWRTGTRAFQSVMVVTPYKEGLIRPPQDHLDDLESFFYVLMWIAMLFAAPKRLISITPESIVCSMEAPVDQTSKTAKLSLLHDPLPDDLTPWFAENDMFCTLLESIGGFLDNEVKRKAKTHGQVGTKHHDIFIGHLNDAIEALQADENGGPDPLMYLQRNTRTTPLDEAAVASLSSTAPERAPSITRPGKRRMPDSDDNLAELKRAHRCISEGTDEVAEGVTDD